MAVIGSSGGGLVACAVLCASLMAADPARPQPAAAAAAADSSPPSAPAAAARQVAAVRWREGVLVENQVGRFERVGERIQVTLADQPRTLTVLENLALERVAGLLDQHGDCPWLVTGVVTEYRGRNCLLLQRAVVQPAVAALAPSTPNPPRS